MRANRSSQFLGVARLVSQLVGDAELLPPVPVGTAVHDLQIIDSVPCDPTDQPLSVIATPTYAIPIKRPSAAPTGIDWTRLSAQDLEEIPILAELKRMMTSNE